MSKSQKELESMVENQKKQLTRYETRLKDVVAAYKSLLKEKEALDASLASLTSKKSDAAVSSSESVAATASTIILAAEASSASGGGGNDDADQLRMQISTLMNSLATLSAEKSKMEASFQADKKSVRNELKAKDQTISELQDKLSKSAGQTKLEVEKVKSKLIIERHEWEKESNNQLAMVRELQKLLADERQIKENLQMQLNDMKNRYSKTGDDGRFSEITAELEQTKRKLKENERELSKAAKNDIPSESILKKLQSEMMNLKQQHTAAIQSEQHRAYLAEERNKALAAMHEERVASLESRLAELSATVGLYDRLRQTDQDNIAKFKERIAQLSHSTVVDDRLSERKDSTSTIFKYNQWDVNELINEILLLHNVLLIENSKLDKPVDLFDRLYITFDTATGKSSFNAPCNCSVLHETLLKEKADLLADIDQAKNQIETQKSNIKTLQTKIEVLNRNLDEQETELRNKNQEHKNELRAERNRWKEAISNTEVEYRAKQAELEGQLQKQRERSLALLEEKENEIATLKASFDVFMMPKPIRKRSETAESEKSGSDPKDPRETLASMGNSFHGSSDDVNQTALVLSGKVSNSKEPMPMLHYVHELSRKEVEITSLRRAKHLAEQTLRQALQDKAASQQQLYEKIANLEENVDRLERCKTREGANLEYLKNVFLSFLLSNDKDGQCHKVNAISAVLQFSPNEMSAVNKHFNANENKNFSRGNEKK
ncbi:GRIP and coiled-coil domain-containing protein 1 [Sitodiplosis mosellana]|uniref:GRIP and coiled-coil domain-containing protein 1 n=1 Tax=Sitodiplosis mosellana TaxID=263140 RepID=UPI0024445C65|nr:GRIP and coiled-coil domain-containing protein 1 [Sitodiplosis mosellana]